MNRQAIVRSDRKEGKRRLRRRKIFFEFVVSDAVGSRDAPFLPNQFLESSIILFGTGSGNIFLT